VRRAEAFEHLYHLYRGDSDWPRIAGLLASARVAAFTEDDWDLLVDLVRRGRAVFPTSRPTAPLTTRLAAHPVARRQWPRLERDLRQDLL